MAVVQLDEFIGDHRDEIIERCAANGMLRASSRVTDETIRQGALLFLDPLCETLRLGESSTTEFETRAALEGYDRLLQEFTVLQLFQFYRVICESVISLALALQVPIDVDDFEIMDRCLDYAIAGAVSQSRLHVRASRVQTASTQTNAADVHDDRVRQTRRKQDRGVVFHS